MKKTIIIIFALILIFSCQSNNQTELNAKSDSINNEIQPKNDCLISNESLIFLAGFFPFEFKDYNTHKLLNYFQTGVSVDSIETNNDGYITRSYTFSDKNSNISFFVKINHTEEPNYFYLNNSTIKSDLFKSRNGIKMNMSRNDFFNAIKSNSVNCDTFTIQEGDMATFYHFIFEKDNLKTIEIIAPE